jgi:hypothetical protein
MEFPGSNHLSFLTVVELIGCIFIIENLKNMEKAIKIGFMLCCPRVWLRILRA